VKKLLVATTNSGKFEEYQRCLSDADIELVSMRDFPGIGEIEEIGKTYEENAILKVKTCFEKTGIPSIGDDGGFEVEFLDGAPGLHSHRWLGEAATDHDRAVAILERLKGVPREKRSARLGSVMAFWDGEHLLMSANWVYGYVPEALHPAEIQRGFPYKSVLFVPEFNKLYKDLNEEESLAVNHRIKNALALKDKIFALWKERSF